MDFLFEQKYLSAIENFTNFLMMKNLPDFINFFS